MTTTVRRGSVEDLDALVALDGLAITSAQRRAQIENGLSNAEASVALVHGIARGYAILNHRFFGRPFLELLYVASECRRTGVGSALVDHVQKHASGPDLFTSTNRSNEPMRALLHKLGFEESGIIHNLDPGDPELVFYKRLS